MLIAINTTIHRNYNAIRLTLSLPDSNIGQNLISIPKTH